jgi:hypothetical protein
MENYKLLEVSATQVTHNTETVPHGLKSLETGLLTVICIHLFLTASGKEKQW